MADEASLEQVRAELGAMLSNLEELLLDQPGAPIMAREYRPLIVLPRLEEISVDANVLLFCIAVSVAAGLLFGLLPAWHAGAVAASVHKTAGARAATSGRGRQLVRRGLVVVQMGWLRRCSSGLDWPCARSSGWWRSTPDSIRLRCPHVRAGAPAAWPRHARLARGVLSARGRSPARASRRGGRVRASCGRACRTS